MTDVATTGLAREVLFTQVPTLHAGQVAREVLRDSVSGPVRGGQVAREVELSSFGTVHFGQLAREILRSRRDSPYPHFPVRLFRPPTISARLSDAALSGGQPAAADAALEAMDAGGRWVIEFGETPLWTAEMVETWRMFVAAGELGVMNVIVPMWDRRFQGYAQGAYAGETTFGQVVWRDTWVWEADEVRAATAAEAPAGATQIALTIAGLTLQGGEHFSIYGSRYGWRLYRVLRTVSEIEGVQTVEIRPPLREWIDAEIPLNFDSPRCTMRCEGDIEAQVELLRLGRGTARFVESFDRYP